MHGLVVNVGAEGLGDVEAVALCFAGDTEMFLLITDKVFGTSNHPRALDTLDGGCDESTSQVRIGAKSLLDQASVSQFVAFEANTHPVSTTLWRTAKRAANGPQLDVYTFVAMFLAHGIATGES